MSLVKDPEGSERKFLYQFAGFKDKRVLEIGCGEGRLTWKYAGASRLTLGFDPDHNALRVARVDCPTEVHTKTHFICASSKSIPLPKESFDIALLTWSL